LKNDTLQPLKQMDEQLAFTMKELTTRTQGEAHVSTLGSSETLIPEISRAKDDSMLKETPVLEEAPIHQLEDQTGVEIESVDDEDVELVWEDDEPNGKILNSTCVAILDNTCAQSCDEITRDSCEDDSPTSCEKSS